MVFSRFRGLLTGAGAGALSTALSIALWTVDVISTVSSPDVSLMVV
jgi:hypothetical protein